MHGKLNFGIWCLVIYLSVTVDNCFCCNGYKFHLLRMTNCNGNDAVIIADQNITASMNKQCDLTVNGCMTSTSFQTAKVTYEVYKNGAKLIQGTKDVCNEMTTASDDLKAVFSILSFPDSCPVTGARFCSDDSKKISLKKYKSMMGMAKGKTLVKLFFEFDGGRTACFESESEITK